MFDFIVKQEIFVKFNFAIKQELFIFQIILHYPGIRNDA